MFGCERFYIYLFGKEFKLITDNMAFQFIYNGTMGRSQARIERWGLRLSPFKFTIVHRPGKENIADFISRHPDQTIEPSDEPFTEEFINFVVDSATPVAFTREEIVCETASDSELCLVMRLLKSQYIRVKIELSLGNFSTLEANFQCRVMAGSQRAKNCATQVNASQSSCVGSRRAFRHC